MSTSHKKFKKLESVVKIKNFENDKCIFALQAAQKNKMAAENKLHKTQADYVAGVDRLNIERASLERNKLEILERALDFLKSEWVKSFQNFKEMERVEKECLRVVNVNRVEIKQIGKISGKYFSTFQGELAKNDQKNLDEVAIRRFTLKEKV